MSKGRSGNMRTRIERTIAALWEADESWTKIPSCEGSPAGVEIHANGVATIRVFPAETQVAKVAIWVDGWLCALVHPEEVPTWLREDLEEALE